MRNKQEWMAAEVTDTRLAAGDTRLIEFAPRGAVPRFDPGSHTNLRVHIGTATATRTYTCLPAPAGRIRIAVKRHVHSRGGSRFMWALSPGDMIEVTTPENRFELSWRNAPCLLVAGGIGISATGLGELTRRASEQLKKEFVSVVSRELREPLAAICGALDEIAAIRHREGDAMSMPEPMKDAAHLTAEERQYDYRNPRVGDYRLRYLQELMRPVVGG